MKQQITISSGDFYRFNAGQAGRFLILREASQSVILRGDALRPLEIERGDTVDVSAYDELEFHNNNETSVYVEYQVADVELRIKSSSTAINGALNVNRISEPVVVARIQEPLDIAVTIPDVQVTVPTVDVAFPASLEVSNFPVPASFPTSMAVSNFPAPPSTQQVIDKPLSTNALPDVVLDGQKTIAANPARQGVILQAADSNTGPLIIGGFLRLNAGGVTTLPASNALTVSGVNGDTLYCGEVL
ncbi:hypothetical protein [Aliivibrio kagoshimensis]|uniref:hypothetical protein n=1 Tax=Aliivibrio kagoshimensis TaxID=2910230 RepID=UPI003D0E3FB1